MCLGEVKGTSIEKRSFVSKGNLIQIASYPGSFQRTEVLGTKKEDGESARMVGSLKMMYGRCLLCLVTNYQGHGNILRSSRGQCL